MKLTLIYIQLITIEIMLVVMNITAKVSFFIYFGEIVRKTLGLVKYFIYLCRIKSLNL